MFIGGIYSIVVFLACVLGAIVGLGGGIFIRPIFDAIGYHNTLNISFFASSAIFSMAIVSTIRKMRDGTKINMKLVLLISLGAIIGGVLGNLLLEHMVSLFSEPRVLVAQVIGTVTVLILSLILTAKSHLRLQVKRLWICPILGLFLGIIGAFLVMGGGPINVPLVIILFGLPIKTATAYSIVIIFFSHLSRLVTMGFTVGYAYFDLRVLVFVVAAAALGGFFGAKLSKIFSENTVKRLFQGAISAVILLNIVNAFTIGGLLQ